MHAMRLFAIRVTLILLGAMLIPAWFLISLACSIGALADGKDAEPSAGEIWLAFWFLVVEWTLTIIRPDQMVEDDEHAV